MSSVTADEKCLPVEEYKVEHIDFEKEVKCLYTLGEHDGASWILIDQLQSGLYFHFEASCDFTGFDCQGGGNIHLESSLEKLYKFVHYKRSLKPTVDED